MVYLSRFESVVDTAVSSCFTSFIMVYVQPTNSKWPQEDRRAVGGESDRIGGIRSCGLRDSAKSYASYICELISNPIIEVATVDLNRAQWIGVYMKEVHISTFSVPFLRLSAPSSLERFEPTASNDYRKWNQPLAIRFAPHVSCTKFAGSGGPYHCHGR